MNTQTDFHDIEGFTPKTPRSQAEAFIEALALDMTPEQIADAEARIAEAKKASRKTGLEQLTLAVVETVSRYQITAADVRDAFAVLGYATPPFPTRSSRTIADAPRPRSAKASRAGKVSAGVVMFRNPAAPEQTYTGKGRKPGWFIQHLTAGGSIEELRAPAPR